MVVFKNVADGTRAHMIGKGESMRVKYKDEIVEVTRVHITGNGDLRFSLLKDIASYSLFDNTMFTVHDISKEETDHIMHEILTRGYIDLTDVPGVKVKYDYTINH